MAEPLNKLYSIEDNDKQLSMCGSGPLNTPIGRTVHSTQTFSFEPKDHATLIAGYADEGYRSCLGPMPVEEFLRKFMEFDVLMDVYSMPATEGLFDRMPKRRATAGSIRHDLFAILDGESFIHCPGFKFKKSTSSGVVKGILGTQLPDICCYSSAHLEMLGGSLHGTDMGFAQLFVDITGTSDPEPFVDPPLGLSQDDRASWEFLLNVSEEEDRKKATVTLGRNVAYAAEVFARQHRHCCYSVFLRGTFARLARWDRAGSIVTESFNILTRPDLLCQFLWCFAHMSDAGRGYDLTVETASQDEHERFRSAVEKHVRFQCPWLSDDDLERAVNGHYQAGAVSAMIVAGTKETGLSVHRCLFSRPVVFPLSATGRGTRGYWALDTDLDRMVFIKDTWRYLPKIAGHAEYVVLSALSSDHHIEHVPPLLSSCNVPYYEHEAAADGSLRLCATASSQMTMTQEFLTASWRCSVMRSMPVDRPIAIFHHTHTRLSLGIVGYSLLHFRGTSELLHASYDVLLVLDEISKKVQMAHRDVSPVNIVLYREEGSDEAAPRKGYLIDWDIPVRAHKSPIDPAYRFRLSASWQFQSARVLKGAVWPSWHFISDDMASLLYTVLYCALLWLPHNQDDDTLKATIHHLFDYNRETGGGGENKYLDAVLGLWVNRYKWSSPLDNWTKRVFKDLGEAMHSMDQGLTTHNFTPDRLKEYWRSFLDRYADRLKTDDRRDDLPPGLWATSGQTLRMEPYTATRLSAALSCTGDKRHLDEVIPFDIDSVSPLSKRTRIDPEPVPDVVHIHPPVRGTNFGLDLPILPPDVAMLTSSMELAPKEAQGFDLRSAEVQTTARDLGIALPIIAHRGPDVCITNTRSEVVPVRFGRHVQDLGSSSQLRAGKETYW